MAGIEFDGVNNKIELNTGAAAADQHILFNGNAKDFYVALDDSADKLVIGEGSTVGTNSILTITDDSLTIGDASAVATKIVFDGNAQDFYVGLDDSADDLIIGLGSTVGTTPAITINEDLQTTIANYKNPLPPFRNLIINGDFRVFQRASASTAVGNGSFTTADRWKTYFSNDGAATTQQHTMSDAERATTGHSYAWQWDCGTADGTIGAGQTAYFRQTVEAQNCSGLAYGSSAAKTLTLSFWVKSAKTGTYSISLQKHDSTTYAYTNTYAISSADTWEYKTITITPTAGSTSLITGSAGDIAQDNGKGLILDFWLASGSDYNGTADTWSSNTNHLNSSSQANWLDSTSNDFYITGIQLEVGSTATDFEHLPYDVQEQRCQRYCMVYGNGQNFNGAYYNATSFVCDVYFPTKMRAAPSVACTDLSNSIRVYTNGSIDYLDTLGDNGDTVYMSQLYNNGDASATSGHAATGNINNGSFKLTYDSEL